MRTPLLAHFLVYLLAFLLLAVPLSARAEYRAFELHITDPSSGVERTEISTLDPVQYVQFYPVKATTKVTYKATWMCRGNTSARLICVNPKTAR